MSIQETLERVTDLVIKGKFEEGLQLVNDIEEDALPIELIPLFYSRKGSLLQRLGKLEDSLKTVENGLAMCNNHSDVGGILDLSFSKATILWSQGKYKNAVEFLKNTLSKYSVEELSGHGLRLAKIDNMLGICLWSLGELDDAMSHFLSSRNYYEEKGHLNEVGVVNANIGMIHSMRGEHKKAAEYYLETISIADKVENDWTKSSALSNLANSQYHLGDTSSALKYHLAALDIYSKAKHRENMAAAYQNIGNIYVFRGEVDEALRTLGKCLDIKKELGNPEHIGMVLHSLGVVSKNAYNYDSAIEYLLQALEFKQEVGNPVLLSTTYLELFKIYIQTSQREKAEEILHQMKGIEPAEEGIPDLKSKIQIAEAILYSFGDLTEKKNAIKLFQDIRGNDVDVFIELLSITFEVQARLSLVELEGDASQLRRVDVLVSELERITRSNRSFTLHIQSLILKSRLALIQLNIMEAEKYLDQARRFCEEKQLLSFIPEIESEFSEINQKLQTIIEDAQNNPDILFLLNESSLSKYVAKVLNGSSMAWIGIPTR